MTGQTPYIPHQNHILRIPIQITQPIRISMAKGFLKLIYFWLMTNESTCEMYL